MRPIASKTVPGVAPGSPFGFCLKAAAPLKLRPGSSCPTGVMLNYSMSAGCESFISTTHQEAPAMRQSISKSSTVIMPAGAIPWMRVHSELGWQFQSAPHSPGSGISVSGTGRATRNRQSLPTSRLKVELMRVLSAARKLLTPLDPPPGAPRLRGFPRRGIPQIPDKRFGRSISFGDGSRAWSASRQFQDVKVRKAGDALSINH